jgi:hypothetical protein
MGKDFLENSLYPKIVKDVVGIAEQIFLDSSTARRVGPGDFIRSSGKALNEKRGISVWLGQLINANADTSGAPTLPDKVGLFMSLNRFSGSLNDYAVVTIPLEMAIANEFTPHYTLKK